MNKNINESFFNITSKNIIILKFIFLIILIFLNTKFKKIEKKQPKEFLK